MNGALRIRETPTGGWFATRRVPLFDEAGERMCWRHDEPTELWWVYCGPLALAKLVRDIARSDTRITG